MSFYFILSVISINKNKLCNDLDKKYGAHYIETLHLY